MTNVTLQSDEELTVRKSTKSKKPSFYMIGNGTMNHKIGIKSIDLLQEAMDMTSDEKFTFSEIRKGIKWDAYDKKYIYAVKILSKNYTPSQKVIFSRGYKTLREKDIVKRVKRGTYMINPSALIPNNFDEEWKKWNEI